MKAQDGAVGLERRFTSCAMGQCQTRIKLDRAKSYRPMWMEDWISRLNIRQESRECPGCGIGEVPGLDGLSGNIISVQDVPSQVSI
jgi:hypothetical protein